MKDLAEFMEEERKTHPPVDSKKRPDPRPGQVMSANQLKIGGKYCFHTKYSQEQGEGPCEVEVLAVSENGMINLRITPKRGAVYEHEYASHELGLAADSSDFWGLYSYLTPVEASEQ